MERLTGVVRHYAWGDPEYLPRLQGRDASGEPEAELWMGAHPAAPGMLGNGLRLDRTITDDAVAALGAAVCERFDGHLPFLAKVLAASEPLSIQAHPSLAQARAGFARENEAGIAHQAPERTYRDANHKPEVLCALTRFEALCGFRSVADAVALVARLDGEGVAPLRDRLGRAVLAHGGDPTVVHGEAAAAVFGDVLSWVLRLDRRECGALADAAVAAAARVAADPEVPGRHREALAWLSRLAAVHPGDPGVVVSLLLEHVVLEPGQAVFLSAGNLHAYLHGAGVELMANSDNVVRGGLTVKHIDVEELLAVVDCTPSTTQVQSPTSSVHRYETPVPEFSLTRIEVREGAGLALEVVGPEILVVTDGSVTVCRSRGGRRAITSGAGEAVWVPASTGSYELIGSGVVHRCATGDLGPDRGA